MILKGLKVTDWQFEEQEKNIRYAIRNAEKGTTWIEYTDWHYGMNAHKVAESQTKDVYLVHYSSAERIAGYPPTALRLVEKGRTWEREMGYDPRR